MPRRPVPVMTMTTGEYLRNLREQKDLSMRQVMIRSQGLLDKTTISRIEKNQRRVSMRAAYAFARIYEVPLEEIAAVEIKKAIPQKEAPLVVSSLEKSLLERFRQLPRSRKLMMLDMATGLAIMASGSVEPGNALKNASGSHTEFVVGKIRERIKMES